MFLLFSSRPDDTVGSKVILALATILAIFLGGFLIAIFYNLLLFISSKNPKDHDLTNLYFIKLR